MEQKKLVKMQIGYPAKMFALTLSASHPGTNPGTSSLICFSADVLRVPGSTTVHKSKSVILKGPISD